MHRAVLALSRALAIAGGAMLAALVMMTCLSIAGREINAALQSDALRGSWLTDLVVGRLGVGELRGQFELLEAGIAFCIFAFMPYAQATAGHATVDLLAERLPAPVRRWLAAIAEVAFAAVLILIALQLWSGMESKRLSGQTSLRLGFPVWWGYALSVPPAFAAALVGVYMAGMRLLEAATGRTRLPEDAA